MKKLLRITANEKGSVLLSAFVVMVVLSLLAAGILGITLSNTQQAKVVDSYEGAFYTAEGLANVSLDSIKKATVSVYNDMLSFPALYDTFFSEILDRSRNGIPETVDVDVQIAYSPISANSGRYSVSATAKEGDVSRTVTASVDVERKEIILQGRLPDDSIVAGDELLLDRKIVFKMENGATASVNQLKEVGVTVPPSVYGQLFKDGCGKAAPEKISVGLVTSADVDWDINIDAIVAEGAGSEFNAGLIQNTTIENKSLYCPGSLIISSSTLKNVIIYVGGSLTIYSSIKMDNVTIFVCGSYTVNHLNTASDSVKNLRVFAGGAVHISGQQTNVKSALIYSKGPMHIADQGNNNFLRGLFYSRDVIKFDKKSDIWGQTISMYDIDYEHSQGNYELRVHKDADMIRDLLSILPESEMPQGELYSERVLPPGPFFSNETIKEA